MFKVIAPSGIQATVRGLPDAFPFDPPSVGAGMQLDVVIQPTTVSFSRIQVKEPSEPTTGLNGYFIANPPLGHTSKTGANDWHPVIAGNLISENAFDHAWSSAGAINASGTYTWPIHAVWRVGSLHTATTLLPGWTDQVHTLTSGTMKIEKLGRTVTRGPGEERGMAQ